MRRTTVTRITHIVFLVWLIVTVVLLWQTLRRHARWVPGHEIACNEVATSRSGPTVYALPLRSRS